MLAIVGQLGPGAVERVLAHLKHLGGPVPDEVGLRRLLRLPWLGRGGLPLWLRDDLVRGMPEALLAGLAAAAVLPSLSMLLEQACGPQFGTKSVTVCRQTLNWLDALALSPITMIVATCAAFGSFWIRGTAAIPLAYALIAAATLRYGDVAPDRIAADATIVVCLGLLILREQSARPRPERFVATPGHPWVNAAVACCSIVVAIDLVPKAMFEIGPFQVALFGRSLFSAVSAVAALWAFHAMGRGLPALLTPTAASSRQPSSIFETAAVRLGLALAFLAGIVLIALLSA